MADIIDTRQANLVVVERQQTVATVNGSASAVSVASPGPQGPPGQDGGSFISKIAATILGGHRAVRATSSTEVGYASNTDPAHADDIIGITLGAAAIGSAVQIADNQEVTEPSWAWTPFEPIYLGSNGILTQSEPTSETGAAFVIELGFATSPTSMRVRIGPAIHY